MSDGREIYSCPSPDDCGFSADSGSELLVHVNTAHSGEYRRPDWPDTEAGRRSRSSDDSDENGASR